MIERINDTVLEAIKNFNPLFNGIEITNNILKYNNESVNLADFNLNDLFESYQLNLDLNKMSADDLFEIIKLNADLINANKGENYGKRAN